MAAGLADMLAVHGSCDDDDDDAAFDTQLNITATNDSGDAFSHVADQHEHEQSDDASYDDDDDDSDFE